VWVNMWVDGRGRGRGRGSGSGVGWGGAGGLLIPYHLPTRPIKYQDGLNALLISYQRPSVSYLLSRALGFLSPINGPRVFISYQGPSASYLLSRVLSFFSTNRNRNWASAVCLFFDAKSLVQSAQLDTLLQPALLTALHSPKLASSPLTHIPWQSTARSVPVDLSKAV
jgi:hypothetical protein